MKTSLSKKNRSALEEYIYQHGYVGCLVRKPYVVVAFYFNNLTGVGFSKWNPNDKSISRYEWSQERGQDIALGRALVDVIMQMDKTTLASYLEIARSVADTTTPKKPKED